MLLRAGRMNALGLFASAGLFLLGVINFRAFLPAHLVSAFAFFLGIGFWMRLVNRALQAAHDAKTPERRADDERRRRKGCLSMPAARRLRVKWALLYTLLVCAVCMLLVIIAGGAAKWGLRSVFAPLFEYVLILAGLFFTLALAEDLEGTHVHFVDEEPAAAADAAAAV